ncbi:cysteine methyltransferase, partial [Georgenia sp. 10Sc9-8]|nr:cysteine methyltransferase [Georgenia halotolerans]
MGRLHERLVADAEQQALLEVAYRTVATPVGELLLAATEVGLVRVAFTDQDPESVLRDLARRVSPRVLRAPARLDPAVRELEEYFTGRRHAFDVPLDLRLAAGF